ncbi:unnamed protein product [Schistocephalus solidus]|uniref:Prominin-1 n=1 Tax=Schistocephalus solidus TaxID=70667 RepID=A0A183TA42_SCHSO|nr:unnamed protein product [Schistocephalus solidus]
MIIPTALGCVAAIFAAILQYQNGGLLNVFLKPVPSTDGHSGPSFDIQQDPSVMSTNLMDIVWGKLTAADLAVLAALPTELGGGQEGVAKAIENPNREGQIIVTFLVCLVFAGLGLLAIFVFSFVCCCCCSSGENYDKDEEDRDKTTTSPIKEQNVICCGLHLLAFIMTALLLLGLAISIGFYFGAANVLSETMANSQANDEEVVVWLEGNSSSFSISRIMQFFTSNFGKFGSLAITSAKKNVEATVSTVKNTLLEVTLPNEISTLLTVLMTQFKLTDIREAVNDMVYAIGNATVNSEYISSNYNSTVPTILNKSMELEFILNKTVAECSSSISEVDGLKNNFDPKNVLPVPPNVTTMLNRTNTQLQDLKAKLDNITKELEAMKKDVMTELQNKLDLNKILDGMNNLLKSLEQQFSTVNEQVNNTITTVSGYLEEYSGSTNAVLYVLSLPCILAGIIFLSFFAVFLFEALQRHLFSFSVESASQASAGDQSRSRVCGGGGMFCISSGLLLLPVILFGLFAVVTVTVGGLLHAELCPYIAESSGIDMSDYVINSKVQVLWDQVIAAQVTGEGGGTAGNDFTGIINLKAPRNPLYAIKIGCNPQNAGSTSKTGLLGQMGIENLVNISALLESPILTEGINNAKKSLVDGIVKAKLGENIPNDTITQIKTFTVTFQNMTTLLNLSRSAKYLQEHVFKTEEIKTFANKLSSNCSVQKNKLIDLVSQLETINVASSKLRDAYDGLNNETMALNSTKLELEIEAFKKVSTFL